MPSTTTQKPRLQSLTEAWRPSGWYLWWSWDNCTDFLLSIKRLLCPQGWRQGAALVLLPAASPGLYVTRTSPWGRPHVARWELSRSHWKSHAVAEGRWGEGNRILKVPLLMAEEIWARCSTTTRVRVEGACLLPVWRWVQWPSSLLLSLPSMHPHCTICVACVLHPD